MNNLLRQLRAENGWSQAHFTNLLYVDLLDVTRQTYHARRITQNVSRQTVNAIESGRYDASLPLAFAITRLFSTPI